VALLRARHPVLGAPSCAQWEREAERLATVTRQALADRAVPIRVAPPVAAPESAPVVASLPLPTAIPDRVHFALDRAELSERSRAVLDVVVDSLARVRNVRIVLEGHTDVRASDAYNADLSARRARAVREYLVSRGLSASGIELLPRGREQLEGSGQRVDDHARNRRVIMRFTTADGVTLLTLEQREDVQPERR
jgi:outer membrane protein OmpA-like peptidoglycan-associated protein